jgi:hypothetical protein
MNGMTEEDLSNDSALLKNVFVDGIDFDQGLAHYSDETAYLDVIRSYCLHSKTLLEKINAFVKSGEIPLTEYAVIVHGLRGSSYGIYAIAAGQKAEELEKGANAGNIDLVMAETGSFIAMMELLLSNLGELLEKAANRKKIKIFSTVPDPALLSRLLEAVKGYKAGIMEQIIKELETYEYESDGGLIIWLREQMDNLEYDAIRERLEAPARFDDTVCVENP